MKHKSMHDLMEDIWKTVIKTRDSGQKEYAHEEKNVFANFERVANLLGVNKEKVLMTYLLKHIDGIAAFTKGHESQREDVRGRITDAIVYLCLLWAMVDHKDNEGREDE
jgi:hypothetical protein